MAINIPHRNSRYDPHDEFDASLTSSGIARMCELIDQYDGDVGKAWEQMCSDEDHDRYWFPEYDHYSWHSLIWQMYLDYPRVPRVQRQFNANYNERRVEEAVSPLLMEILNAPGTERLSDDGEIIMIVHPAPADSPYESITEYVDAETHDDLWYTIQYQED